MIDVTLNFPKKNIHTELMKINSDKIKKDANVFFLKYVLSNLK